MPFTDSPPVSASDAEDIKFPIMLLSTCVAPLIGRGGASLQVSSLSSKKKYPPTCNRALLPGHDA